MAAALKLGKLGIRARLLSRAFSDLVHPIGEERIVLVDTLSMLRKLETHGIPSKEAEAILLEMMKVIKDISHTHRSVLQHDTEKLLRVMVKMHNESREMKEVKSQIEEITYKSNKLNEHAYFSMSQHEVEKFKREIVNMREELRDEVKKAIAELRSVHELEKRRLNAETTKLSKKIDQELCGRSAYLDSNSVSFVGVMAAASVCCICIAFVFK